MLDAGKRQAFGCRRKAFGNGMLPSENLIFVFCTLFSVLYLLPDAGCRIPDTGYRILGAGYCC